MTSKQLALAARSAADDKKGVDPVVLDLRHLTDITDFFLIVNGTSDRHVCTIADGIEEKLIEKGIKPLHVEGRHEATWILLDYGSVMVHVFHYQMREFYNLERLWGDAEEVKVKVRHERKIKSTRRSSASRHS